MITTNSFLIENEIIELYNESQNNIDLKNLLITFEESNFKNKEIEGIILELIQNRFNKYNSLYGNIFEINLDKDLNLREDVSTFIRKSAAYPGHIIGNLVGGLVSGAGKGVFSGTGEVVKGVKQSLLNSKIDYLTKLKNLHSTKINDSLSHSVRAGILSKIYHGLSRMNYRRKNRKIEKKIVKLRDKLSLI